MQFHIFRLQRKKVKGKRPYMYVQLHRKKNRFFLFFDTFVFKLGEKNGNLRASDRDFQVVSLSSRLRSSKKTRRKFSALILAIGFAGCLTISFLDLFLVFIFHKSRLNLVCGKNDSRVPALKLLDRFIPLVFASSDRSDHFTHYIHTRFLRQNALQPLEYTHF